MARARLRGGQKCRAYMISRRMLMRALPLFPLLAAGGCIVPSASVAIPETCALAPRADQSENCSSYQSAISDRTMASFAEPSYRLAILALVVSAAGIIGILVTFHQGQAANKRAEDEFAASFPPVMRAAQVAIDVEQWAKTGALPPGEIWIVNEGQHAARIEGTSRNNTSVKGYGTAVLMVCEHPPMAKPFKGFDHANELSLHPDLKGVLPPGIGIFWEIVDACGVNIQNVADVMKNGATKRLFIIGRIHYNDNRGSRYHTIFCRAYCPKTKRFKLTPEYPEFENRP